MPHNPIPTLIKLYQHAKNQKNNRDYRPNRDVIEDISFILQNHEHQRFNAQSIANLSIALCYLKFSKRDIYNNEWRNPLFDAIYRQAERMNPQGTSNTAWAGALMGAAPLIGPTRIHALHKQFNLEG